MLYVRGAASDYDAWSALGNDGWSFSDVLPLFKKVRPSRRRKMMRVHNWLYSSKPSHLYKVGQCMVTRDRPRYPRVALTLDMGGNSWTWLGRTIWIVRKSTITTISNLRMRTVCVNHFAIHVQRPIYIPLAGLQVSVQRRREVIYPLTQRQLKICQPRHRKAFRRCFQLPISTRRQSELGDHGRNAGQTSHHQVRVLECIFIT